MRKSLILLLSIVLLSSCGGPTALYNWGGGGMSSTSAYEQLTYKNFSKQTPQSLCELVVMYEGLVNKPGGSRNVPPPGVCAEYGYLLLAPETVAAFTEHATTAQRGTFSSTDYASYFREHGLELMQKEMDLYPESISFIRPLLERFSNR
ncbi:MAG: DUF4810 domain-containing protein [Bacteroidales bacterium]|nr:DUF4810 domain-containing protein [Bacteroidales bacterium]